MISVDEICEKLNDQAPTLAPDLLPNGRRSGNKWMCSGVADTGRSESMFVHLTGEKIGKWFDMGNAAHGEDRGDMLDLVRIKMGFASVGDAVQEAKRILGIVDSYQPNAPRPSADELDRRAREARERAEAREAADAQDREAKARGARALYLRDNSVPIAGTPAEHYLLGRLLDQGKLAWPGSLRFNPEVWCRDTGVKEPAMLAPIYDAAGVHMGTHRTWLQRTNGCWTKLAIPRPKKVLGNMWGGFIPINKGASGKSMRSMPAGEPVYATEGIEDALVIRLMKPAARIITAISVPNFGGVILPEAAKRLIVVCDRDENATAQGQLERSIGQQQARGLEVQLVMPPEGVKDMNDWLVAWRRQERAA